MSRPGERLRALLSRWCRPVTMERLVDPVIADLQAEYDEARRLGARWSARRVVVCGYVSLGKALVAHGLAGSLRSAIMASADDRQTIRRMLSIFGVASVVAMALVAAQPSWIYYGLGGGREMLLFLPQALVLSIPVGLVFGILLAPGRAGALSAAVLGRVLLVALLAATVTFTLLGWVVPSANQAFRQATFERLSGKPLVIAHGAAEQTIHELARDARREAERNRNATWSVTWRAARAYYLRLALALTPVALALFALVAITRRRRPSWELCVIGFASVAGCYVAMVQFEAVVGAGLLPAPVAAVAANVLFVGAACLVLMAGDLALTSRHRRS